MSSILTASRHHHLSITSLYRKYLTNCDTNASISKQPQPSPTTRLDWLQRGCDDHSEARHISERVQHARESAEQKSLELPPVKLQKSSDVERQDTVPKRGLLLGYRANKTERVEPGDCRRHLKIVGRNATRECVYSPGKDGFSRNFRRTRRFQVTSRDADDATPATSLDVDDSKEVVVDILIRPMNVSDRAAYRHRGKQRHPKDCFGDSLLVGDTALNTNVCLDNNYRSPFAACSNLVGITHKTTPLDARKIGRRDHLPTIAAENCTQSSNNNACTKLKPDREPIYADPVTNASTAFNQRIGELFAIELRTIRWEKTRRIKKKRSRDSL